MCPSAPTIPSTAATPPFPAVASVPVRPYLGLHTWNFELKKPNSWSELSHQTLYDLVRVTLSSFLSHKHEDKMIYFAPSLNGNKNKWYDKYQNLWRI